MSTWSTQREIRLRTPATGFPYLRTKKSFFFALTGGVREWRITARAEWTEAEAVCLHAASRPLGKGCVSHDLPSLCTLLAGAVRWWSWRPQYIGIRKKQATRKWDARDRIGEFLRQRCRPGAASSLLHG